MQPRARQSKVGERLRQSHQLRQPALQRAQAASAVATDGLRKHRPDYWLVMISVALLAIGLMVVYAISPALTQSTNVPGSYYVTRQLLAIGLSIIAFLVTARLPLSKWRQFSKLLVGAGALATLAAIAMPVNANYPAHRWVRLGSLSFQSVELLKFAVLVWLAGFLADRIADKSIASLKKTLKPVGICLLLIGVVVGGVQHDLGSTGVILVMLGAMTFVAGLPFKRVLLIGAAIAVGALLLTVSTPYRRARLDTYLHPSTNCQSTANGYQACQALIAVGSGGFIGLGLGSSVQAYGYLPEAANDSIFAIYAEKFGFIGCIILLLIFGALFARIVGIAERAPDNFSRLLAVGIVSWLAVQSMVNMGAMIGLLPLKGITLPFISYGGTSVVFVAAAIGIVFQISYYTSARLPVGTNERSGYDDSRNGRRIGRAYHPDLSGRARA